MAHQAGLSDKNLRTLVANQQLRHPIQNVYIAAQAPDDIPTRIAMLRLVVPEGCFIVDRTAAWLHGTEMALAPNDHLTPPKVSIFRHADHGRLRNELSRSGERTVLARDLTEIGGLCVTTPLRTALDLGRFLSRDQAIACLDALLRLGFFSAEELLAEVPRFAKQRGVRQLRALAPLADGRSQSQGESVLRLRWLDAGLPRPQLQIEIREAGRVVYYLDIGLEELLLAVEYDGARFHSTAADQRYDLARRDWLAHERGWVVRAFRGGDIYGRHDAEAALQAAFRQARASLGERTYIALGQLAEVGTRGRSAPTRR
ncbi:hypothetical protein ISU10_19915 [Nocardioides agariphilus]|jgi:hypothetical protein|uniref:DUF559 domain-containing protein n=1 Tax=Nocardioides agariphilus TaxID=433664 RepID=A0A930VSI0_9ACTN|nr:hypothetical protein [Nocardioides agariphilus]MBF4770045.1 hypothetical protein [Nocardioides agariphilus]